jgi:hypothetical protein
VKVNRIARPEPIIITPPPVVLPPPPAPVFGPPASLTVNALATGNLSTWPVVTGAKYQVWRRSKTDKNDAQNLNNPWAWQLMTPEPISGNLYLDEFARELEEYEYAVWSIDFAGVRSSTSVQATVVSAAWAPQNHLCHWSRDLSKGGFLGWFLSGPGGVGTVSGTVGSQTLTFPADSCHLSQYVACYPLTNRTYSYLWTVKGTAGQTIKFHAHDDETGGVTGNFDFTYTFGTNPKDTDGFEDVTFTRDFGTLTGRRMRIGINTYGVTARSIGFKRVRVAAGNISRTDLINGYEVTEGPGTTWCEPLQINTQHTGGQPVTVRSWHKSMLGNIQSIRVAVDTPVVCDGVRSISRGHHITGNAGNFLIDNLNGRFYSLNPMMAGRYFGRVFAGDYGKRYVQDRCYAERTSGVRVGLFRGRSATNTFKVMRTLYRDIDGRYVNADGSYVRSSYGSSHGTRPGNAPLGFETAQAAYLYSLYDPNDPTNIAPPYDVPEIEVAWNEVTNRPGFSRHEDLVNFHGVRGTPDSPARIHHNRLQCVGPWDYVWHETGNFTLPYNYGNILTTFTLNGATVNQGPGNSSGTAILSSDLFSFDANYLFKNPDNIEIYSNLVCGIQGIISIQAGRNQWSRGDNIVSSGKMPPTMSGVVIPATTHRRSGWQNTHYAGQNGKSGRAFDHTTVSSFAKNGTAASAGATSIAVTAIPAALPIGYEVRFANGAWALLTAAAAIGATTLTTTPLSAAVPAGTTCKAGYSEVAWRNNGIQNAKQAVAGLSSIGLGDSYAPLSYSNDVEEVPTPEEELIRFARAGRSAARTGMSAGPIIA